MLVLILQAESSSKFSVISYSRRAIYDISKMNQRYIGLTSSQIREKERINNPRQQMKEHVVKVMQAEDDAGFNQSYLEGLHFMLNQPEFSNSQKVLSILELLEHRSILGTILPKLQTNDRVNLVIGTENPAEVARDCSLVISRYGLEDEASGIILVVGPTRMAYPRVISAVISFRVIKPSGSGALWHQPWEYCQQ